MSIKNLIERKIQNVVRRSLLDWPLDFGVETAVLNNVRGDYHEFGVFEGRSFIKSALSFKQHLPKEEYDEMQFWAYDSFEGLPETMDKYAPSHFTKGAYSASEELFLSKVKAAGISRNKVNTVAGFYDQSLTEERAKKVFETRKIAMTYIDCDIYESTVPILKFLTHGLQVGSIIVIDDWIRHHAHPGHGMQRAFNEWKNNNPSIKMNQIVLSKRVMFIVYET